jgi:hypothetical protein
MGRSAGRKSNIPRAPQPEPDTPEGDEIGLSARQDPAGSPIPGLTGNILNYETVEQKPAMPDGSFDEFRGMMAHGVPNDSGTTTERALAERNGPLAQHSPPTSPELAGDRKIPPAIPVYLTTPAAGGRPLGTLAAQRITIPASGSDPVRIAARDRDRTKMLVMVETAAGSTSISNPAPSQPAVPATGVAQQNVNNYPVQVVISANGATITNVSVNGITVGTAAGTYTVPAFGSISIAYSVATPTWVWSYAGPNVLVSSTAPSGIRLDNQISNLSAGNGGLLRSGMAAYQTLENQQDELWAVSNDGSACTLSVIFLFDQPAAG